LLYKRREMPKEQFKCEVEKELTGRETEPDSGNRAGAGDGSADVRDRYVPRLLSGDDLCLGGG
jgi:hypothetical protein